jgi:hypothetical protein
MISDLEPGFKAYVQYVALKNHFTSPYYDYFKYDGKVKAGRSTFERRNDKFFFVKLAKKKDVQGFLVANMVDNPKNWIGDVITSNDSDKVYTKWLSRQQSLQYIFSNDLHKLDDDFDSNIIVNDHQHPLLLKLCLRKEIQIETLIILNGLCKFFKYWSRSISENVIWPQFKFRCVKYKPFVNYEPDTFKKIVVGRFKT